MGIQTPEHSTPPLSTWRAARWIPTLYFAEGLPYMLIMSVAGLLYKDFDQEIAAQIGLADASSANETITWYMGLFGWAWVIKPLWSPFVDRFGTKRQWVLATQLLLAIGFGAVAMIVRADYFFYASVGVFGLLALVSATHDIAIDGLYIVSLSEKLQAQYVGIRSTFYRAAMFAAKGLIPIVVGGMLTLGWVSSAHGAWSNAFWVVSLVLGLLFVFHSFVLPRKERREEDLETQIKAIGQDPVAASSSKASVPKASFQEIIFSFFRKDRIGVMLGFLLLYRLSEAQINGIGQLFMKESLEQGGLGLSNGQIGFIYGTLGLAGLVVGGILGGIAISVKGLKFWLWPMIIAINLPNAFYIYMAAYQPTNEWVISVMVTIEQFGYGFGFAAYLMYMIYMARGRFETAHYAFTTGFMALGMNIPLMFSGKLQVDLGYTQFFIWTLVAALPIMFLVPFLPLEADFGKKN